MEPKDDKPAETSPSKDVGCSGVTVPVPLSDWSKLHQRVGFLEGALKGLRYVDDVEKSLDLIEDRYAELS